MEGVDVSNVQRDCNEMFPWGGAWDGTCFIDSESGTPRKLSPFHFKLDFYPNDIQSDL